MELWINIPKGLIREIRILGGVGVSLSPGEKVSIRGEEDVFLAVISCGGVGSVEEGVAEKGLKVEKEVIIRLGEVCFSVRSKGLILQSAGEGLFEAIIVRVASASL